MGSRVWPRAGAVLVAAVVGAALLSGSDQPVTAHPFPRWQQVASPPFASRTHPLGVHVGRQVLVLGGVGRSGVTLRDGASYDLRTGLWHRLVTPVAFSDRDRTASVPGSVVVVHRRAWWRYDVRAGTWSRMRDLPSHVSAPTSFGSELYALARRRVVVYSVPLGRWTPLPVDRLRPALTGRAVTVSRHGTVVTGYAAGRAVADRWDGLRWSRSRSEPGFTTPRRPGELRVDAGGRLLVVRGDRAWIRLP